MTVTFAWWSLPLGLTIGIWLGVLLWPVPNPRGAYDFGPVYTVLGHLLVGVIATPVVWCLALSWRLWA